MLKEERFERILKKLSTTNKIYFEELANDLMVSEDTVRRDIDLLNKRGLLVKVRGGAIHPRINPLSFQDRSVLFNDAKHIIGLKAQQVLENARTVFLDGGTTVNSVISHLPAEKELRVITNSIATIPLLEKFRNIEIIILGGRYLSITQTNVGLQTCREIDNYQADVFFLGACAIDTKIGVTAAYAEEGEVKKTFMNSAFKTVVLSSSEKLNTVDYFKVSELSKIDTLITDLPSDDARLDRYRQFDIEIL